MTDVCAVAAGDTSLVATPSPHVWHSLSLWKPARPGYPAVEVPLRTPAHRVVSPAPGRLAVGVRNGLIMLDVNGPNGTGAA